MSTGTGSSKSQSTEPRCGLGDDRGPSSSMVPRNYRSCCLSLPLQVAACRERYAGPLRAFHRSSSRSRGQPSRTALVLSGPLLRLRLRLAPTRTPSQAHRPLVVLLSMPFAALNEPRSPSPSPTSTRLLSGSHCTRSRAIWAQVAMICTGVSGFRWTGQPSPVNLASISADAGSTFAASTKLGRYRSTC